MDRDTLAYLSAHQMAAGIRAGRFGPVALMESHLERIARLDERLHAFVEVYADTALAAAKAAEAAIGAGHRIGPWHGLPVAVKDIVEIEGRVTTGGSMAWRDRRSSTTATLVRRMIAAGMIVIGKTHTVEFAMGGWGTNQRMGTPRNPWDLTTHRAPGGSSAGTGVAVAAGLAPWGIGTDTGGSVRLPSAWCGLAGLKTTVGRISTHAVMPLSHTLDTPGPMARTVGDAAALFDVLHGEDPRDPKTRGLPRVEPWSERGARIAGRRLAVMPQSERAGVDAEVLACFDASVEKLRSLGADVVALDALPRSFDDFAALTGRIIFAEGYAHVGDLCDDPSAPLDEDVRPRILAGKHTSAREYIDALLEREQIKRTFAEALNGFEALLTPSVAYTAPPIGDIDQGGTPAGFTRAVNYLDRCAMTVTNGFDANGLPVGLQFVCAPFAESVALELAHAYESATEWAERHPEGL